MTDSDVFATEDNEDEGLPEGFTLSEPVTDEEADLDDMFSEGEADFSLMYPPNDDYNAVIQVVEHRQKINDEGPNAGRKSRGWNISVQLDCPNPAQAPYNGSFFSKYIWFGFDGEWNAQGLQQLCNFLEGATGEKWADRNVDLRSFHPEKREIRGKQVVAMAFFDKVPVLVTLKKLTKLDKRTDTMEDKVEIVKWAPPVPFDPDAEVPEPF